MLMDIVNKIMFKSLGFELRRMPKDVEYADVETLGKGNLFSDRFREIVSDPLNLLIERVPAAGYVDRDGCVILHNGNRVPVRGRRAYYYGFSEILMINRGVHEPLEEYCFGRVLARIAKKEPLIIELGSYWAHYSMWFMKKFPNGKAIMVEPDLNNLEVGRSNFKLNGFNGKFINAYVGENDFILDKFLISESLKRIEILHADIQGFELEMLSGANQVLSNRLADYVMISTHSEVIHHKTVGYLNDMGYRLEVSSGFDNHTTSYDGFVLASSPNVPAVFEEVFSPLGRREICLASSVELLNYLSQININNRINDKF